MINFRENSIYNFISNQTVQIIITLLLYVLLADSLPMKIHQLFYTISLFIKDMLIWIMPVTIGAFISNSISSFKGKAVNFVLMLVIFESISNFSSIWYSFFTASMIENLVPAIESISFGGEFDPLWRLPLEKPEWWSPEKGVIYGVIVGFIAAFYQNILLKSVIKNSYKIMETILTKIFANLIPLFILGFAAHMHQLNMLSYIIENYLLLITALMLFLTLYTLFLFLLSSNYSLATTIHDIKNLLPAGFMALCSGCSLSTMPWTISGTSKNLQDKSLAEAIIPATINVQQVGDCIVNAFLCFLIYKNFYGASPDPKLWLQFSIIFTLARFMTAAMLGGAIFIMIPIYEKYLSFTPEMVAIILALNVILNPIVTAFNVITNGALCKLFENIWTPSQKSK